MDLNYLKTAFLAVDCRLDPNVFTTSTAIYTNLRLIILFYIQIIYYLNLIFVPMIFNISICKIEIMCETYKQEV